MKGETMKTEIVPIRHNPDGSITDLWKSYIVKAVATKPSKRTKSQKEAIDIEFADCSVESRDYMRCK
jgi:hypothetical protein